MAKVDEECRGKLQADAASAHLRLHVLVDARDGGLDGERIRAAVPEWREASLWFCGPLGFGETLRRDFAALGFPVAKRFHQELFAMRQVKAMYAKKSDLSPRHKQERFLKTAPVTMIRSFLARNRWLAIWLAGD